MLKEYKGGQMTKRQIALERIRVNVAKNGRLTQDGIRALIENRVSRESANESMKQGMRQFEARNSQAIKQ